MFYFFLMLHCLLLQRRPRITCNPYCVLPTLSGIKCYILCLMTNTFSEAFTNKGFLSLLLVYLVSRRTSSHSKSIFHLPQGCRMRKTLEALLEFICGYISNGWETLTFFKLLVLSLQLLVLRWQVDGILHSFQQHTPISAFWNLPLLLTDFTKHPEHLQNGIKQTSYCVFVGKLVFGQLLVLTELIEYLFL